MYIHTYDDTIRCLSWRGEGDEIIIAYLPMIGNYLDFVVSST